MSAMLDALWDGAVFVYLCVAMLLFMVLFAVMLALGSLVVGCEYLWSRLAGSRGH